MEKVEKFLEDLKSQKGLELLQKRDRPSDAEAACRTYAEIAKEMGHDVSEDDLVAYAKAMDGMRRGKTGAAVEQVEALSDQELGEVAGGGDNPECKDTYKQRENCWHDDGCDVAYNHYKYYACHHFYHALTPIPCSSTTWD